MILNPDQIWTPERTPVLVFLTWTDHLPISCPRWTKQGLAGSACCTHKGDCQCWIMNTTHTPVTSQSLRAAYLVNLSPLPHWNRYEWFQSYSTLFSVYIIQHICLWANAVMLCLKIHVLQGILRTKLDRITKDWLDPSSHIRWSGPE